MSDSKKTKQYWRTVNLLPLTINIEAAYSKVPPHFFVITRSGRVFDRLPFAHWVDGCCNADMQVVAYCYKVGCIK